MQQPFLFIYIATGILFALTAVLFWLVFDLRSKVKLILKGEEEESLEEHLKAQRKHLEEIGYEIHGLKADAAILRSMAEPSIQKVGMVRFNPFGNVGGDHSFSIALLDSKNNGVVLSGLYLREGARVYSKPITDGKSEYQLSDEEKQALGKAMQRNSPKAKFT